MWIDAEVICYIRDSFSVHWFDVCHDQLTNLYIQYLCACKLLTCCLECCNELLHIFLAYFNQASGAQHEVNVNSNLDGWEMITNVRFVDFFLYVNLYACVCAVYVKIAEFTQFNQKCVLYPSFIFHVIGMPSELVYFTFFCSSILLLLLILLFRHHWLWWW